MKTQTMIAVGNVEMSSEWYQDLLECRGDHGGPFFERRVSGEGEVILLLHHWGDPEHPSMTEEEGGRVGKGVEICIQVEDLSRIWEKTKRMWVQVAVSLRRNDLAHRDEFKIRDPDGYLVTTHRP